VQSLRLQDLVFVRMSRRSRRRKQNRGVRYRDRGAETNSNNFHVCLSFAFLTPSNLGLSAAGASACQNWRAHLFARLIFSLLGCCDPPERRTQT